ncbi:MAG: HIT family protein [Roseburia sp.]|nr:HIT family protein [Roseburia sp.]
MKDSNCIFCKLASGEIPTNSIYEDDMFRVILDAAPASKGHALIIPKEHYKNIYEIDEEVAGKAMKLAKKMAAHMTEKLNCDGFNLLQNNGEVAGQTVFHFHLHLIPRYKGMKNDDILMWNHETFTEEEIKEICTSLKLS